MKKRKIFAALLALLILLQLFAGCDVSDQTPSGDINNDESSNTPAEGTNEDKNDGALSDDAIHYNAVFFDNAVEWIRTDFIHSNPVAPEKNLSHPTKRTFIIDTQEKYDQIFSKSINDFGIDFTKQMIAVYTFVDTNTRENELADIRLENDTLKIVYEDIPPFIPAPGVNYGDSCQPYQRWFVVTLDKVDVASVTFEWKKSGT